MSTSDRAQRELDQMTRIAMDTQLPTLERAVALLIAHQRRDIGSCLCGWDELGRLHAAHQAGMLAEAGLLATAPPSSVMSYYS